MRTRPLGFFEELGSRYDRGATLNFVTVATVRATLSLEEVEAGLRCLQLRHPSLSMDIAGKVAATIPLAVREAPRDACTAVMSEELRDGLWAADTAPARCTLLQHPDGASTLLFTLWHPVSDGKSGILAMRDLLAALAAPDAPVQPLPPTKLEDYLPPDYQKGAVSAFMARQRVSARVGRFQRWGNGGAAPPAQRTIHVARVHVPPEQVAALTAQAKQHGITLHGALSAAIARAIVSEGKLPSDAPLLSFHPVDMRGYLARRGEAAIPESVGYFVSFVDAALRLSVERDLWDDAKRFHQAVHGAMEAGVPRYAPTGGALLTRHLQRFLGVSLTRRLLEGPLAGACFALSNLGALERMGVVAGADHPLGLEALHFAGTASMTTNICCSAAGLDGAIWLNVGAVSPGLPEDAAARLAATIAADLSSAAGC